MHQITKKFKTKILVGTNKSQFVVITSIVDTVRLGRFHNCWMEFLPLGHTKNTADEMFADIARSAANQDYFNHL